MDEADARALAGKRVVITRAAEQSKELVEALRKLDAVPVVFPVIRIAPPRDFGPLDAALRGWADFDWVLFTSQNAVRGVSERAKQLGIFKSGIHERAKVGAVGQATAEDARLAGFHVSHIASRARGSALAEDLGEALRGNKVFLPRSDRADPALLRMLDGYGAKVTEVIAYRTMMEIAKGGGKENVMKADAVLFFSPSAVAGFFARFGAGPGKDIFDRAAAVAIGPVTNAALKTAGIEHAVVAQEASVAGIVDALANFFEQREHPASAGAKRA
jgi:uroporphyrinogen III methyltransferase/synthase